MALITAIEVRRATPVDAFAIAAVHVASWRAAYRGILPARALQALSAETRAMTWLERLGPSPGRAWVAERAGDIIGFLSAGPSRDRDATPRVGEVYSLYVHPDHWGSGAGRALLERAAADFARRGCREVALWVLAANQRARRFYQAAGFTPDGASQLERAGGSRLSQLRYRRPL